ncbi:MAG: class I SAM-dependent methyltransferase, partial [Micrococcales bacterium]|nr:class I SAM-dependent methyltransferase [Micrococcales bacterium]
MANLRTRDVALLTSPAGLALAAALPPYADADALGLAQRLRAQGHDPDLIALTLTQSRLRARATGKLGVLADRLLLTPDGLEQATRPALAARHAARFVAAGVERVLDLGCGLGLDALAFAQAGLFVDGVDADPATAALAAHNLASHPGARATAGPAEQALAGLRRDPKRLGVWFDPARRTPGRTDAIGRTRRVFALDQISPSWEFVRQTAMAVPATGAKLSPGFPHASIPPDSEAEWVSFDGEVLECALWWGQLVERPGRSATVLRRDGSAFRIWQAELPGLDRSVSPGDVTSGRPPAPGDYLYDPDRAVVRAGLVGALVARTGGAQIGPDAGYVVSPDCLDVPWARRFVVLETLPATSKAIRAWARATGTGRMTIKKRGSRIDPDRLRRSLKLDGSGTEATIVLTAH